jgi:hypothetical protein
MCRAERGVIMARRNGLAEAFKETGNVVGLASAFALSAALLNPLPLLAGLVVEAAYLLFVPDSTWFRRRVAQREKLDDLERRRRMRDELLPRLRPLDQNRYPVLEETQAQIARDAEGKSGGWHERIEARLDYLLEQYLVFAGKAMQYRLYLVELAQNQAALTGRAIKFPGARNRLDDADARLTYARLADTEEILGTAIEYFDRQEDQIARAMEREKDGELLEVMRKNAEVLRSSKQSVHQIGKTLRSVEHQLDLVANTFTLINTQLRTGSPERIIADVEDVVGQSEALTQTMQELAPMEEALARLDRIQLGAG